MKEPAAGLYEADYHAWTQQQAAALKRGDFASLDLPNLVEEIESLGRSEERELESRLAQLMMHLLKFQFQADRQTRSWAETIREQRRRVELGLRRTPSLRPQLAGFVADAYGDARLLAERETRLGIETFPEQCPYTAEQVMTAGWLPPAGEP